MLVNNPCKILQDAFEKILKKNGFSRCFVKEPYTNPTRASTIVPILIEISDLDCNNPTARIVDDVAAPVYSLTINDLFEQIKIELDRLKITEIEVPELLSKIIEAQQKRKPKRKEQKAVKEISNNAKIYQIK